MTGLILDSSALIAVERHKLTAAEAIENVHKSWRRLRSTVHHHRRGAGHGIYPANTPEFANAATYFLDELKATIPIYPLPESTAEIIARIGGEQAVTASPFR